MARALVTLNSQGRLTLPAAVRRRLGLGDGARLEVEVEDGAIRLRPTVVVPAEDAWALTEEHIRGVKRALQDIREGRVYRLSEEDLLAGRFPRRRGRRAKRPAR